LMWNGGMGEAICRPKLLEFKMSWVLCKAHQHYSKLWWTSHWKSLISTLSSKTLRGQGNWWRWMKIWHEIPSDSLWIMFHSLKDFMLGGEPSAKFGIQLT
jgi:hypothetical protein